MDYVRIVNCTIYYILVEFGQVQLVSLNKSIYQTGLRQYIIPWKASFVLVGADDPYVMALGLQITNEIQGGESGAVVSLTEHFAYNCYLHKRESFRTHKITNV